MGNLDADGTAKKIGEATVDIDTSELFSVHGDVESLTLPPGAGDTDPMR